MSGPSTGSGRAELAGALSERVEVQRRAAERDALGGAAGAWGAVGSTWAEIVPDGTGAPVAGEAIEALPRWRVTLRADADVAVGDRLIWRGRRLRVRARTDDPRLPDRVLLRAEEER
jgi:head-tail adaptor